LVAACRRQLCMPNRPLLVFPVPGAVGKRLLRIAQALRARTPAQAKGFCYASTMEFSLAARHEGLHTDVVVWSVRDDPDFLEHWAVLLGKDQVVDLTRQQVDGRNGVSFHVDDYPANFVRRRAYPAQLFLPGYEAQLSTLERARGQQSVGQVCHWRWLMLRHDCCGNPLLRLPRIAHAAASLLKAAVVGLLHASTVAMRQRRDRLMSRLMTATAHPGAAHAAQAVLLQPHAAANDGAFTARPAQPGQLANAAYASKSPTSLGARPTPLGLSCDSSQTQARMGIQV
jgi:hypothetical protein